MKPGRELPTGGHAACPLPRRRELAAGRAKLGPSRSKAGLSTSSWQAGGASFACCRVRAALLLLFPCSRVAQGCHCPQLWSLCPVPALLGSLDVTRSGYKPLQLPAVPRAGWHGSAPGREVGELTLAAASLTAPHQHPHASPPERSWLVAPGCAASAGWTGSSWTRPAPASVSVTPTGWQRSAAGSPLKERHVRSPRAPMRAGLWGHTGGRASSLFSPPCGAGCAVTPGSS